MNNLSTAGITLRFDVSPVEDPAERKQLELVRLGPSLAELEAQIQGLAKQNADLLVQISELKRKSVQ